MNQIQDSPNSIQMHRTCFPRHPLLPLDPEDLETIIKPEMVFAWVPRASVHVTGPFGEIISQLLTKLHIGAATPENIIVLCLKRQVPALEQALKPQALSLSPTTIQVQAQSSSRPVTLSSSLEFPIISN